MNLPIKPIARDTVIIEGTPVEVRGLSRSEALHFTFGFTPEALPDMKQKDRMSAAEVYVIEKGTGATEAEAIAFRDNNDTDTVGVVVDRVLQLSGLIDDKKKGKADPKR